MGTPYRSKNKTFKFRISLLYGLGLGVFHYWVKAYQVFHLSIDSLDLD